MKSATLSPMPSTRLVLSLHPLDGPKAVIRVDPAPAFILLSANDALKHIGISFEVGRVKNKNKNPVAERAALELEEEILRLELPGGPVTEVVLTTATARLNSRIRSLSSRELWTQRNQFTNEQIPLSDLNLILLVCPSKKITCPTGTLFLRSTANGASLRSLLVPNYEPQSYKVTKAECYLGPAALPPRRHLYPPALATLGDGDEETYLEQLPYLKRTNFLHPMSHHRLPPTYCDPTSLHQVTFTHDPEDVPLDNEQALPTEVFAAVTVNQRPQRDRQLPKYLEDFVCD